MKNKKRFNVFVGCKNNCVIFLLFLALIPLNVTVAGLSGEWFNEPEPYTTNQIVPSTLNLKYSPTNGLSGDINFKVNFIRSGDSGRFCPKMGHLEVSKYIAQPGGGVSQPLVRSANSSDFSLCGFTKTLSPKLDEQGARSYFSKLCRDNIGKTIDAGFSLKAVVQKATQLNRDRWTYDLKVPVDLQCACVSPRFSNNSQLQNTEVGSNYTNPLSSQLTGGAQPIRYTLNGVLPPGMKFNSNGTLDGVPQESGNYSFSVTARDSCPTGAERVQKDFSLKVCARESEVLSQSELPGAYEGSIYNFPLQANGTQPVKFSTLDWRALPAGLKLNDIGLISGVPSSSGLHRFTIRTEDACGKVAETPMSITVNNTAGCQQLTFESSRTLPSAQLESSYFYNIAASGGGSIKYQLRSDSVLPDGLVMDGSGRIRGNATRPGNFSFAVTASSQCSGNKMLIERQFTVSVLAVTDAGGSNYSFANKAKRGTPVTDRSTFTRTPSASDMLTKNPSIRAPKDNQNTAQQSKLKPIVIVPGKPRTLKVNPAQYAGIDFKSARLVNPKNNLAIKGFRVQARNGDSRQCAPNPRCLMLTLIPPQKMPNGMFKLRMQGANNKHITLPVEIKGSVKQVTNRKQPIVNTKRPVQRPSNIPRTNERVWADRAADRMKQSGASTSRTNRDGSSYKGVPTTGKAINRKPVKQVTNHRQPVVNTKRPAQRPSNLPNKGVYSGASGSGGRPPAAVVSKSRPTVKGVDPRNSVKGAPTATDSRKVVGVKPVLKPKAGPSGLKGDGVNPAVIGGSKDPRGGFDSRGSSINPR